VVAVVGMSSHITAVDVNPAPIFTIFYFLKVEIIMGCSENALFLFPNYPQSFSPHSVTNPALNKAMQ